MSIGITESVVEEVKARTDIAELIASYGVQVRQAGSSLKACCPFHQEKTPSFNINVHRGFYHCFGCGESGDAIKFVQKFEGIGFAEAVRKLAAACGVKIEAKEDPEAGRRKRLWALMADLAQFYHRCLGKLREAALARDYLQKRELGPEIQDDFLIGYAPNGTATIFKWAEKYGYTPEELAAAGVVKLPTGPGDSGYHRFGGRLMFAVRDRQARVVAFSGRQLVENKKSGKYVNSPETLIFKKSNVLFGFDRAAANIAKSPHREVIVCEGQIDCIRLHVCGFPVAVAGQGTAFTEEHVKMLKRVADAAVLVYDDDAAGHKAAIRSAGMLLAAEIPVRVVRLPDGDDPDSFLRTKGVAAFRRLLDGAESIVAFQCQVECAKETNPSSIDAVSRITRSVLFTVAQCPSAVLRASMVDEVSKLLSLPVVALTEELSKLRTSDMSRHSAPAAGAGAKPVEELADEAYEDFSDEPDVEDLIEPIAGEEASMAIPPSPLEQAMMAFLLANEYDVSLDGIVGEFLPQDLFAHDFTRRFVETWRTETAVGEDRFAEFADALNVREREWFDRLLVEAGKSQASTLPAIEIMQDFVRSLWCAGLERRRGELQAAGDPAADLQRMRISMDLKRLRQLRWGAVKDFIRKLMKGEY